MQTLVLTLMLDQNCLNGLFISDIFGNVKCEDIQKHFIKGQDLVALASVQGSFNTWSRILMEQMTGE